MGCKIRSGAGRMPLAFCLTWAQHHWYGTNGALAAALPRNSLADCQVFNDPA